MKAVVYQQFGGPEAVHLGELPEPTFGPGEVLIEVRAASVNPVDVKVIAGYMGEVEFPAGIGSDAAGVVRAVGEGVDEVSVGDEVFGLGSATQAELAVLRVAVPKPAELSWPEAAASGVAGETAYRGLTLLEVGEGTTLLIDGASGGVGSYAVQLAVLRGATVIATSSTANHEYLASLGATPITYGDGLAQRVADVAPDGVDAVFDVAGRTDVEVLKAIAPSPQQVLSIANFGAADSGIRLSSGGEGNPTEALEAVAELAASGKLQVSIEKQYPFDQAAEAFAFIAGGHVRGKLVLTP